MTSVEVGEVVLPAPVLGGPDAIERYSVAVDFDGVLHSYVSGWQGANTIPDPPVEGAIEWLNAVVVEYDIVILTTRAADYDGAVAVGEWLHEHGFVGQCVVTDRKPQAVMYVDDRGWRFHGGFPSLRQIRYSRPWRTGDPPRKQAKQVIAAKNETIHKIEERQRRLKREKRELKSAAEAVVDWAIDEADGLPLEEPFTTLAKLVGKMPETEVE